MKNQQLLARIQEFNDNCSVSSRLADALHAVVQLHTAYSRGWDTQGKFACDECGQNYPCPTVRAVERELQYEQR
jgi:hypothetical protein